MTDTRKYCLQIENLKVQIKHGKFGPKTYSIDDIQTVIADNIAFNECTDYPHYMTKYSDEWTKMLVEFYSNRISPLRECEKYGFKMGRYFHYHDPRNWIEDVNNYYNTENKIHKLLDN